MFLGSWYAKIFIKTNLQKQCAKIIIENLRIKKAELGLNEARFKNRQINFFMINLT